jgi:hypothetical protein
MRGGRGQIVLVALAAAMATSAAASPPARAFNPLKPLCGAAGLASGAAGRLCSAATSGGRLLSAGKKLLSGHVGSAVKKFLGAGGGGDGIASTATTALALAALGTWVVGGARYVVDQTAHVLGATTSPRLTSTWFSATYWRVAGIAALLTLPFLFAAAVQALVASDLALLARSALGCLPLAMLGVTLAAPLATLLLSATDQLGAIVSSAAGHGGDRFLARTAASIAILAGVSRAPFLGFFAGLLIVGVTLALWLELLARAAAVYVVVLLVPLAFAALVWPARRHWMTRTLELLVALILSKFVIVAVLSLGGAALGTSLGHGFVGLLAATALVALAACAPWALLRLLPMTELAASAALRGDLRAAAAHVEGIRGRAAEIADTAPWKVDPAATDEPPTGERWTRAGEEWVRAAVARMRSDRRATEPLVTVAAEPSTGGTATAEPSTEETAAAEPSTAETAAAEPATEEAASAAEQDAEPRRGERSPGLGEIWQLDDFAWRTLELGADREWPPRVWPDPAAPGLGQEPPARPGGEPTDAAGPPDRGSISPPEPPPEGRL